jgi:Branched-chain amino acid transport system / permease component
MLTLALPRDPGHSAQRQGLGVELSSRFGADGIGGPQVLWEDGGLAFCGGWRDSTDGRRNGVLIVLPASEQPTPATLDHLAHEYSFNDEPDSTWAALWYVHRFTPLGRNMYFTGADREVARLSGVPVDQLRAMSLVASSLIAAFAAMILAGRAWLGRSERGGWLPSPSEPCEGDDGRSTAQLN